ncbi:MAG TPA: DUF6232 family protein [Verrucomicrobiae bacterium]|nr:DUF6232 family protein [Verrucomicrobiae bacterium]
MNSTCTCNLCSNQIEFESNAAGQTVACPHCGMDTMLFIPHGQSRTFGTRTDAKNTGMIYQEGNVSVSKTILKVGSSTYPIAAISSFRIIKLPPKRAITNMLAVVSIALFIFGLLMLGMNAAAENSQSAIILGWIFISAAMCVLFIRVLSAFVPSIKEMLNGKTMFGLSITTSARDQIAVTSLEFETVQVIERALQKAISMRG